MHLSDKYPMPKARRYTGLLLYYPSNTHPASIPDIPRWKVASFRLLNEPHENISVPPYWGPYGQGIP